MPRFDLRASTHQGAAVYLVERAIQLLHHGFELQGLETREHGVVAKFRIQATGNPQLEALVSIHGTEFVSFYLLDQFRQQGRYRDLVKQEGLPVLTHQDCHLAEFLKVYRIPHVMLEETLEYMQIQAVYGDRTASRSQMWLMRHIDEGLAVLLWYHQNIPRVLEGKAFCLHPLVQGDQDLQTHWRTIQTSAQVMALAMEYRQTANSALSPNLPKPWDLSPLSEVNHMLVADKVQNLKDFELFHLGTHPDSEALALYFRTWLGVLGVEEPMYRSWIERLHRPMILLKSFLA